MKVLCSGEDCYKNVTVDSLTERLPGGEPHPLALLCSDCGEAQNAIKRLKRYRAKQRKNERLLTPLNN